MCKKNVHRGHGNIREIPKGKRPPAIDIPNTCSQTARRAFRKATGGWEENLHLTLKTQKSLYEKYQSFLRNPQNKAMIVAIAADDDELHYFTMEKMKSGNIRIHNSWVEKYHEEEWNMRHHDRRNMVDGVEGNTPAIFPGNTPQGDTKERYENMRDSFAIRSAMKNFGGQEGISKEKADKFFKTFSKILKTNAKDQDPEKINDILKTCFGIPFHRDDLPPTAELSCIIDVG